MRKMQMEEERSKEQEHYDLSNHGEEDQYCFANEEGDW